MNDILVALSVRAKRRDLSPTPAKDEAIPRALVPRSVKPNLTQIQTFASGIGLIARARKGMMPSPAEIANVLAKLHSLPAVVAKQRWRHLVGQEPPELPTQRAQWLKNMPSESKSVIVTLLEEDAIWVELAQWRQSADQYASAIQLWGRAAMLASEPAWPPSVSVLNIFVFLFRNGDSMANYVSHIRSVLSLLRAPLGALQETGRILEGARKLTPFSCRRIKKRASAEQSRRLADITREDLHRNYVAESWIVARHFCLCYGAEVVPLEGDDEHSKIELVSSISSAAAMASITFFRRKMQRHPVVVTRRCFCLLQGKKLCGVCILFKQWTPRRIFPNIDYSSSLAMLKIAASLAGLSDALPWGTHCFRRGFADEALKAGGPSALFFSGGWKGVAAFAYVQAQTRGALQSAEWLVDFSDSDDDGPQ